MSQVFRLVGDGKGGEALFRAFQEKREDDGFTLIELLVVILIIAILAAIAIPVFLKQREKGWISQMESALKNAATAEQSFATTNNGDYTSNVADLTSEGYRPIDDVDLTITASATAYCIQASHDKYTASDYFYSSSTGKPAPGTC